MYKKKNWFLVLCILALVLTASRDIANNKNLDDAIERNVFVIAYIDTDLVEKTNDWFGDSYKPIGYLAKDMEIRTNLLIDYLRCGSTYHGNKYYDCQKNSLLNYEIYDIVYSEEIPPYGEDGNFDYAAVYKDFDLCNLIELDEIDEIWIWESGNGHAPEWITSRSENSTGNPLSNNMPPFCGKTISTLNFNYMRQIDLALHTYGHRIEGAMLKYRLDNFGYGGYPDSSISDATSFTARPSPSNNYIGNCGDIHRPPNVYTTYDLEYIYDSPAFAVSTCDTWTPEGTGIAKIISCEDWGCYSGKYYIWWMQHIPENWWKDLFR